MSLNVRYFDSMKHHIGIILKNHMPKKHKLSIVDKTLGKIESIVSDISLFPRLRHGSVIQYYPRSQSTMYKLSDIELMFVPFKSARENIFFLHHVLELCYHFFPQGYADINFFETVMFLLHNDLEHSEHKLLFLFRIFVMVGGVSESQERGYAELHHLVVGPLKELTQKRVSAVECEKIQQVVFDCVAQHPYASEFKTRAFLIESGIV